jgi:transcriptional regulator with XRE-family HTH domain
MGEVENGCELTAGGLAADLSFLGAPSQLPSIAFGKLVEFARRHRGETIETLAKEADLDLSELLSVERGEGLPTARSVYQLARVLGFDAGRLMELSGLAEPNDALREAALRFAASSEPSAKLSREERRAFEAFAKVISERSERG